MAMGAVSAYLTVLFTGNLWLGLAMGMLAGAIMSLIHVYLSETLKADQIISGIAIWLFSMGFSVFLYRNLENRGSIEGFSPIAIPVLSELPFIGPVLFNQNVLFYIGLLLVVVFSIILFRTSFGLIARGTGENPLAIDIAGHNVSLIRYISVLVSGAMSGLGGAYLPLGVLFRFSENMTGGRGFIAMAIVIFGGWNPWGILGGSLLFAGVDAFQIQMRAGGVDVPYSLLLMAPYVITILVLVAMGTSMKKSKMPKKLCIPYIKGES
jgi:simple sugar transport system permease protein